MEENLKNLYGRLMNIQRLVFAENARSGCIQSCKSVEDDLSDAVLLTGSILANFQIDKPSTVKINQYFVRASATVSDGNDYVRKKIPISVFVNVPDYKEITFDMIFEEITKKHTSEHFDEDDIDIYMVNKIS